jgi:RimJ/RimL family protein N-acetyltransferase
MLPRHGSGEHPRLLSVVYLQSISIAHAAAVQALASDARVAETSNVPHPYPADGAVTWIRYTISQREQGREINYAILVPSIDSNGASTVVGVCGVLGIGGLPRCGELGYWIGVPYWGRGYATAAAGQLVQIVFEEEGLEELHSSCLVRNVASFRVLEKTGFRHIGYGTHANPKWGPEDRFALFKLTRGEWARSAPASQFPLRHQIRNT